MSEVDIVRMLLQKVYEILYISINIIVEVAKPTVYVVYGMG